MNIVMSQKYDCRLYFASLESSAPIPAAARSKAWVGGCLLAGIAGSNPAGDMGICLL